MGDQFTIPKMKLLYIHNEKQSRYLVWFISLMAYKLLMGHLKQKFDLFLNDYNHKYIFNVLLLFLTGPLA